MNAPVSTWSQDVDRGLAHPDSVAALKARRAAQEEARQAKVRKFTHAMQLLRETVSNRSHVITALHVISSTIADHYMQTDDMYSVVERLDALSDEIEGETT